MSYCPKCGNEITEDMLFCPKCGASLKTEQATAQPQRPVTYRHEKEEKREKGGEKGEKREKHEKHEKHEYAFIGPLIGGIILLFVGLSAYLSIAGYDSRILWALLFIAVGLLVVFGAIYGGLMASRRHPRT